MSDERRDMADNRPIAYLEEGVVVIRASALHECTRNLWGALMGIEGAGLPEFVTRAADEGVLHEGAMRAQLRASGWEVDIGQDEVELVVIPGRLIIRGHIDGRIRHPDQGVWLWEAKSVSRAQYDLWDRNGFDHKPWDWQIGVYMAATSLRCILHVKRRDDGLVSEHRYDQPPRSLDEIKAKAVAVYAAYRRGEMPACDPERYPCERFFLHDEEADDPPGVNDELDLQAAIYNAARKAESAMKARKDGARGLLHSLVGDNAKQVTEEWSVGFKEMEGREYLDTDAMEADGIDVAKYRRKGKPYQRIDVRRRK